VTRGASTGDVSERYDHDDAGCLSNLTLETSRWACSSPMRLSTPRPAAPRSSRGFPRRIRRPAARTGERRGSIAVPARRPTRLAAFWRSGEEQ
jgi:hypothetical protein